MNWKAFLCILVFTICLLSIQPVLGTEIRSGNSVNVPAGTTIDDDLAAAGANVNVGANVSGDLLAAGSQVVSSGSSAQSSLLAGGNVTSSGSVGNNLYAAGGQLAISNTVADNAYVAGGTVTMVQGSRVARDLLITGGQVAMNGTVGRDLLASGGDISINGTVNGNARVNGGNITLGPDAVVRGDLIYSSDQKLNMETGARVLGKTIQRQQPQKRAQPPSRAAKAALWLLSLTSAFIVGAIILAIVPVMSAGVADRVVQAPGWSMLTGFILLVVVPIAATIIALTIIGFPLALILLAMYFISIYISYIFVGLAAGRFIFRRIGKPAASMYLDLLVGLVVVWILISIPFIGGLIKLLVILLGLGALASYRYHQMRRLRTEGHV